VIRPYTHTIFLIMEQLLVPSMRATLRSSALEVVGELTQAGLVRIDAGAAVSPEA
jgi:hypothetical protein